MTTTDKKTTFEYRPKSSKQLRENYNARTGQHKSAFKSFEDFENWYNNETKVCHYCGITETQSQEIVISGILKSNRFPQNGLTGRGQARGTWLEVDRIKPKEPYSENNCVLACYL